MFDLFDGGFFTLISERERTIRTKYVELRHLVEVFVKQAPTFNGDLDLAGSIGKAIGDLDWMFANPSEPFLPEKKS